VIRVCRPGEIRLVAGVAIRRSRGVVVVGVTLRAQYRRMLAREWVMRVERMIKLCVEPVIR
jgi:hypothetical protein